MLGVEAILTNDAIAPGETLVQVPDTSMERLDVDAFRRELAEHGALYKLMGQYTQVFIAQMVQTTACNVLHPVQQRCARWLLMTHDRMHEQDFKLSHEFMAVMLGVQRAIVSVVAAKWRVMFGRTFFQNLARKSSTTMAGSRPAFTVSSR